MIKHRLVSFFVAAAATAALVAPALVEARWARLSAMDCMLSDTFWPNVVGLNNYGQHGAYVYCPLRDDSLFPKSEIATLNVEGRDNHPGDSLTARVCVSFWYEWAGQCSSYASSGTAHVGHSTLRPSRSILSDAHEADFGFVTVYIPNNGSNLTGIYAAD